MYRVSFPGDRFDLVTMDTGVGCQTQGMHVRRFAEQYLAGSFSANVVLEARARWDVRDVRVCMAYCEHGLL